MKLAEEITVTLAGKRIILRPSLRAAMRLERRDGSFASLARELFEGSLTASADVLREHVAWSDDLLLSRIMDAGLDNLKPALIAFVFACSGIPDEELSEDTGKSDSVSHSPVSFADHLAGLYRIATGWIGWPPEVALDATPAEITEAYKGRLDMLKAIFGGNSEETPSGGDWGEKLKSAVGPKVVKFERPSS